VFDFDAIAFRAGADSREHYHVVTGVQQLLDVEDIPIVGREPVAPDRD
jgi:hypothetical protein